MRQKTTRVILTFTERSSLSSNGHAFGSQSMLGYGIREPPGWDIDSCLDDVRYDVRLSELNLGRDLQHARVCAHAQYVCRLLEWQILEERPFSFIMDVWMPSNPIYTQHTVPFWPIVHDLWRVTHIVHWMDSSQPGVMYDNQKYCSQYIAHEIFTAIKPSGYEKQAGHRARVHGAHRRWRWDSPQHFMRSPYIRLITRLCILCSYHTKSYLWKQAIKYRDHASSGAGLQQDY